MARASSSRRPRPHLPAAVVLLLALAPAVPLDARQAFPDEVTAALDSLGRATVESGTAVGLGLGVYRNGEPVFSAGFGYADVENRVPATDSTVFRIGSVTKQFTAAAILRLVDEGRLSLDDELTSFLPDYPVGERRVTIHQLLNHTSGIRSYTSLGAEWQEVITLDLSHDELLALFQDEPFTFEPGEGFAYNNSGYYLLGMIIEEVTGKGYDEYLREEFFEPLGLRDTYYCWERPVIPNRARGYQFEDGEVRNAAPLSMAQPYAAGSLCSSVRDLGAWAHLLASGHVVTEESYRRMTTPEGLPEGAGMRYGYGLVRGDLDGIEKIEHGGGIHGFNALLSHYPESGYTVVALVNLNGPAANRAAEAAARIVLDAPDEEVVDLALTAEERARYLGSYDIRVLAITVFEEGDALLAQGEGQASFRLLYQGGHEFRAAFDPAVRFVFDVEEGEATAVTVFQGGAELRGERVRE